VPELAVPDDKNAGSTEDDEGESHRSSAWMVWLAALPLLYVLSIGPAAMIVKGKPTEVVTWRKVYAPLVWLHENTFLRRPLELYVNSFVGH
jgi:hypothetical protein